MENYKRNTYDLSHLSFQVGLMGNLQTHSSIFVLPGDVIEVDFQGLFRGSPLRRNLIADIDLQLYAFFVPMRHIYSNWKEFCLAGSDEGLTLGTLTTLANGVRCVGVGHLEGVVPKWRLVPYAQIWNYYFRDLATTPIDDDYLIDADNTERWYGKPCCYLPCIWSAATHHENTTDADRRFALVDTDKIDLTDMAKQQARLKQELRTDYMGRRYNDLLKAIWGTSVNSDVEPRPTLCMRSRQWMSGMDVDGTDDVSLGYYSGKTATVGKLYMPPKFFNEHGVLMIMSLLRFPTAHPLEQNMLDKFGGGGEYTYKQISGDPEIIGQEEPLEITPADFFYGSSDTTPLGFIPYGQWFRTHHNIVHRSLFDQQGFPFIKSSIEDVPTAKYIRQQDYDPTFASIQFQHWQSQSSVRVRAQRYVPHPLLSINAGTR